MTSEWIVGNSYLGLTSGLLVTLTQSSDIRIGLMNKHQIELAPEITELFNVAAYM
jgi:hypothetical protein